MDERIYGLLGINPEELRRQQMQQGLLGAGLQMLAASGPSAMPTSLGQIVAQGGAAGLQGYQQAEQSAIDRALQSMQVQRAAQQAEAQKRQQQFVEQYAQTLPEDQRARFMAFPEKAAEAMFREPKAAPGVVGEYQAALQAGLIKPGTTLDQYIELKKPPGTTVPISVSTERSYGGALAGELAKSDASKFEAASNAPRVIETVQSTRSLLDSGNVITGIGAQQRLDIVRFGQLLGVTGKNTNEIVANTQQLFANRAQATLDSIKSSGLGSGQGFSNKDREFLENARLGNITYSPEALKRQLDIEEKVAKATIQSWNNRLKNIPADARTSLGLNEIMLPEVQSKKIPRYNPATGRVE